MEASLILPFFLCAVTAMLYIFVVTGSQARYYRSLTQKAQTAAVTLGQSADQTDPYTRLYDYKKVSLPFTAFSFGSRSVVQRVVVRNWVGYTGESFAKGGEEFVYVTPKGEVYHRSRECSYLNVSIQSIASGQLKDARNWDGSKYTACGFCVKKGNPSTVVYVTNYGTNYHNRSTCRGLKRTVMTIPYSQAKGMRCCSRCGES